jgi:phospholipase C
MMWTGRGLGVALTLLPVAAVAGCGSTGTTGPHIPPAIHRIRHVIVVMQENRSFDNYFGTYPGADGIPRRSTGADRTRRPTRLPTSTPAAWTGSSEGCATR